MHEIDLLYAALGEIERDPSKSKAHPRTAKLMASDTEKMAKKVGEEAVEVAIEATALRRKGTIQESADLIYNLAVLWNEMKITPDDIWKEMASRRNKRGIAEKIPH